MINKVLFSTCVWGDWHLNIFLDLNLKSLLLKNNLPFFSTQFNLRYIIYTSKNDLNKIKKHKNYLLLKEICDVEIRVMTDFTGNIGVLHQKYWKICVKEAEIRNEIMAFIPPDVIWSNNTFRNINNYLSDGKKAIFISFLRCTSETFLNNSKNIEDFSSKSLLKKVMNNLNPLTLTYSINSGIIPLHSELLLWTDKNNGFLVRSLVREPTIFFPDIYRLTDTLTSSRNISPNICKVVDNSDEVFAVSFAPMLKDTDWYLGTEKFSYSRIAKWWTNYSTKLNDNISSKAILFHTKNRNFKKQKESSNSLIRKLTIYKNLLVKLYGINVNGTMIPKHLIDNLLPIFFEKVIRLPIMNQINHIEVKIDNKDTIQDIYDVLKKFRELNDYSSHSLFQELRKIIYPLINIITHDTNLKNSQRKYIQNDNTSNLNDEYKFNKFSYDLFNDFTISFKILREFKNDFKNIILIFLSVDLPAGYHRISDFSKNINKLNSLYYNYQKDFNEILPEKFIFHELLDNVRTSFSLTKATFHHKQFLGVPERKLVYSQANIHIFELPDGSYYSIENKYDKMTLIGNRIYRIPKENKQMNLLKKLFYKISEFSYVMFKKNQMIREKNQTFLQFFFQNMIKNIKALFFYTVHIILLKKYYVDRITLFEKKRLFEVIRLIYEKN